jgi:selenide,water dikinase
LADALKSLPIVSHPDLLVGYNTADDAGVFRISEHMALVQTVDFFPPIVDDPYAFGQIAAANALSDVFAMGGRPVTALNIVAFPKGILGPHILTDILRGGSDKITEAGAVLVGGHSINDKELKYGLAVTGVIDPEKIFANSTAKVGDRLFLTKKLGTGLITTGIKRNMVSEALIREVTEQMAALNRTAAALMIEHRAHAATDITGYGLVGHALEMAEASGVTIRIFTDMLPMLTDVLILAGAGMIPGGANANREFAEGKWTQEGSIDPNLVHLVFDPQTSGGLFIAVPEARADAFSSALKVAGLPHMSIGAVETAGPHRLILQ